MLTVLEVACCVGTSVFGHFLSKVQIVRFFPVPNDQLRPFPHEFKDESLLHEALTHRSFSQAKDLEDSANNERLEFLGDAVLGLVVSERVASIFPQFSEGELSKVRASLISRTTLAKAARRMELGQWLRLGRGEEVTQGREKSSLLANALEAVIGAVYLDGGIEAARGFIGRSLLQEFSSLEDGDSTSLVGDSKSRLQEWTHKNVGSVPRYQLIHESGPDHQKTFEVVVYLKKKLMGRGTGRTKKEAEQRAAEEALQHVGVCDELDD